MRHVLEIQRLPVAVEKTKNAFELRVSPFAPSFESFTGDQIRVLVQLQTEPAGVD